jgi:hypothetical protein
LFRRKDVLNIWLIILGLFQPPCDELVKRARDQCLVGDALLDCLLLQLLQVVRGKTNINILGTLVKKASFFYAKNAWRDAAVRSKEYGVMVNTVLVRLAAGAIR